MNINEINAGVLAYLGDSVYELEIRKYLLSKRLGKAYDLQQASLNFVSAKNQAKFLDKLLDENILNEDETYTVSRARNYKTNSKPKNTDIKIYKKATALEALFGMLYIKEDIERIKEIINYIVGE